MAYYLTTCLSQGFRGRSRRPRPSLVNFEGSAMSWPGPGIPEPRCGYAQIRWGSAEILSTPGPWDLEPAPTIQPPRGIQIGAIQLFSTFDKSDGITLGGSLRENEFISASGLHVALCDHTHYTHIHTHTHIMITRCCLLPDASFHLRRPHKTPFPHSGVHLVLTQVNAACRTHPQRACRLLDQSSLRVISPFWKNLGSTPISVSQTAWTYWCPCACILHSKILDQGLRAHRPQHCPLHHTHT